MIYVGVTNNIAQARQYMLEQRKGMFPDIEMGPFTRKEDALNYILFMQHKFPGAKELTLPDFVQTSPDRQRWWVFSFELIGIVQ